MALRDPAPNPQRITPAPHSKSIMPNAYQVLYLKTAQKKKKKRCQKGEALTWLPHQSQISVSVSAKRCPCMHMQMASHRSVRIYVNPTVIHQTTQLNIKTTPRASAVFIGHSISAALGFLAHASARVCGASSQQSTHQVSTKTESCLSLQRSSNVHSLP